jgi:hypothetical protein
MNTLYLKNDDAVIRSGWLLFVVAAKCNDFVRYLTILYLSADVCPCVCSLIWVTSLFQKLIFKSTCILSVFLLFFIRPTQQLGNLFVTIDRSVLCTIVTKTIHHQYYRPNSFRFNVLLIHFYYYYFNFNG